MRTALNLAWVLMLIALCGCFNATKPRYDLKDTEGPSVDVSGVWLGTDGVTLLKLTQTGDKVTGQWDDTGDYESVRRTAERTYVPLGFKIELGNSRPVSGEIQGRVFLGKDVGPAFPREIRLIVAGKFWPMHWRMSINMALTVAADGDAGKLSIGGVNESFGVLHETDVLRVDGRASSQPQGSDRLFPGLFRCRLPVDGAGSPTTPKASAGMRDVYVNLQYVRTLQGDLVPARFLIPAAEPRRIVEVRYPGPGIFAHILDRGALLRARAAAKVHKTQTETLEGAPCWWVLAPAWEEGAAAAAPTVLLAELYRENPDGGALPIEVITVGRRTAGGPWQPTGGYVAGLSRLLRATVELSNGEPVRVAVVEPEAPALDEFLVVKENRIAIGRWRNGALLEVKNQTLPRMLREWNKRDLTAMITKLERIVLDCSHEAELAKNRAQRAIEAGQQAGDDPELSLVYKSRIEVLKPILSAIKEEVANRDK